MWKANYSSFQSFSSNTCPKGPVRADPSRRDLPRAKCCDYCSLVLIINRYIPLWFYSGGWWIIHSKEHTRRHEEHTTGKLILYICSQRIFEQNINNESLNLVGDFYQRHKGKTSPALQIRKIHFVTLFSDLPSLELQRSPSLHNYLHPQTRKPFQPTNVLLGAPPSCVTMLKAWSPWRQSHRRDTSKDLNSVGNQESLNRDWTQRCFVYLKRRSCTALLWGNR